MVLERALGAGGDDRMYSTGSREHRVATKELTGKEVHLLLRSFHLDGASEARIASITEDLQRLGVRRVSACHCTGDRARLMFADAFGESFFRTTVA